MWVNIAERHSRAATSHKGQITSAKTVAAVKRHMQQHTRRQHQQQPYRCHHERWRRAARNVTRASSTWESISEPNAGRTVGTANVATAAALAAAAGGTSLERRICTHVTTTEEDGQTRERTRGKRQELRMEPQRRHTTCTFRRHLCAGVLVVQFNTRCKGFGWRSQRLRFSHHVLPNTGSTIAWKPTIPRRGSRTE